VDVKPAHALFKERYNLSSQTAHAVSSTSRSSWTQSVYKFGCAFIHLSALHDYENRDPIGLLPETERSDLIAHCRNYHGGPIQEAPTFRDFVPYLPDVLKKISSNLDGSINAMFAVS
jgi:hypothetical protein